MQLTIFNGSPRGKKSNTAMLFGHFKEGFLGNSSQNHCVEEFYLNKERNQEQFVNAFGTAEVVLLGFPLYHDSMPAVVKTFIESLAPFCGREGNPPIGFVVQSGFPEAHHSRYVERYLEKLARRLGSPYLGTVVKGGVEGIQAMPAFMTRKLFKNFRLLGEKFAENGKLDKKIIQKLGKPEHLSKKRRKMFRLLKKAGITNMYWDTQLKKNKAFDKRFDRPYVQE